MKNWGPVWTPVSPEIALADFACCAGFGTGVLIEEMKRSACIDRDAPAARCRDVHAIQVGRSGAPRATPAPPGVCVCVSRAVLEIGDLATCRTRQDHIEAESAVAESCLDLLCGEIGIARRNVRLDGLRSHVRIQGDDPDCSNHCNKGTFDQFQHFQSPRVVIRNPSFEGVVV